MKFIIFRNSKCCILTCVVCSLIHLSHALHVDILLIGGVGDLASKYLWQGFYNYYFDNFNSSNTFSFFGISRHEQQKGEIILSSLLDKVVKCDNHTNEACRDARNTFIKGTNYIQLKREEQYASFCKGLKSYDNSYYGRLFYLSVPPSAYGVVTKNINLHCRIPNKTDKSWLRVVLEKPFGSDKASAELLATLLSRELNEEEIYRIDHYLGKPIVKQILPLRYSNMDTLEKIWSNEYIERVDIVMKESVGVSGRIDFYDQYGVMRDVMQNHLMELFILVAMEIPKNITDVAEVDGAKMQVLNDIQELDGRHILAAQYASYNEEAREEKGDNFQGSVQPTFAAAVIGVLSPRWYGVPFVLVSGKLLNEKASYVRIIFKDNIWRTAMNSTRAKNEIIFYIGGDSLKMPAVLTTSKAMQSIPDSLLEVDAEIVCKRKNQFAEDCIGYRALIPTRNEDAYSSLIRDIFAGEKHNFVGTRHLISLWNVWNNVLNLTQFEAPRLYESGAKSGILDFKVENNGIHYVNPAPEFSVVDHDREMKISQIPDRFLSGRLVAAHTDRLITSLADDIVNVARTSIIKRGAAHLAFSGGKTPENLFKQLADIYPHYLWKNTHIWVVDERCVPFTDILSNFRALDETLLMNVAIPHRNIHPMPVDIVGKICESGDKGSEMYEDALKHFTITGELDYIVLGVGSDGHTASLFSNQSSLDSSMLVTFAEAKNTSSSQRMTLTYKSINMGRNVAILVVGWRKHSIIKLLETNHVDYRKHPVLCVQPSSGNLSWYLDYDALFGLI